TEARESDAYASDRDRSGSRRSPGTPGWASRSPPERRDAASATAAELSAQHWGEKGARPPARNTRRPASRQAETPDRRTCRLARLPVPWSGTTLRTPDSDRPRGPADPQLARHPGT